MSKVANAGAVIAAVTLLGVAGIVATEEDEAQPHSNDILEWWYVTFVYPDGTEDRECAINYIGEEGGTYEFLDADFRLTADQYPDPPDGYEWDHPPDYQYTEDTTVSAVPVSA